MTMFVMTFMYLNLITVTLGKAFLFTFISKFLVSVNWKSSSSYKEKSSDKEVTVITTWKWNFPKSMELLLSKLLLLELLSSKININANNINVFIYCVIIIYPIINNINNTHKIIISSQVVKVIILPISIILLVSILNRFGLSRIVLGIRL